MKYEVAVDQLIAECRARANRARLWGIAAMVVGGLGALALVLLERTAWAYIVGFGMMLPGLFIDQFFAAPLRRACAVYGEMKQGIRRVERYAFDRVGEDGVRLGAPMRAVHFTMARGEDRLLFWPSACPFPSPEPGVGVAVTYTGHFILMIETEQEA